MDNTELKKIYEEMIFIYKQRIEELEKIIVKKDKDIRELRDTISEINLLSKKC